MLFVSIDDVTEGDKQVRISMPLVQREKRSNGRHGRLSRTKRGMNLPPSPKRHNDFSVMMDMQRLLREALRVNLVTIKVSERPGRDGKCGNQWRTKLIRDVYNEHMYLTCFKT